jgi:hypothetical protein
MNFLEKIYFSVITFLQILPLLEAYGGGTGKTGIPLFEHNFHQSWFTKTMIMKKQLVVVEVKREPIMNSMQRVWRDF